MKTHVIYILALLTCLLLIKFLVLSYEERLKEVNDKLSNCQNGNRELWLDKATITNENRKLKKDNDYLKYLNK